MDEVRFQARAGKEFLFFITASAPVLAPIQQPLIQWVPGVKWPGREIDSCLHQEPRFCVDGDKYISLSFMSPVSKLILTAISNKREPFEMFVDWRQCSAVMEREAVTVMPSYSGGGNVVVT